MAQKKLSIVSPVYAAENIVEELVNQIILSVDLITDNYEIILVDDGSNDKSWEKIVKCCEEYPRVKGIKLSRNFGQHNAIIAGLTYCTGQWIVVMDCDLQDNPKEIKNLYNKAQKGDDIVFAKRIQRNDNLITKLSSKIFYKILSYLTDSRQDHSIANFGIYSKRVIENVIMLKEKARWLPLNVNWVGFNSSEIEVEHQKRYSGKSSYRLSDKINLAMQIILTFSDKPLRLTIKTGLLISMLAFLLGIYNIIKSLIIDIPVLGWLSIIVSIWFLSGIIITIIGVTGLYIGRILEETKDRPLYIIEVIK